MQLKTRWCHGSAFTFSANFSSMLSLLSLFFCCSAFGFGFCFCLFCLRACFVALCRFVCPLLCVTVNKLLLMARRRVGGHATPPFQPINPTANGKKKISPRQEQLQPKKLNPESRELLAVRSSGSSNFLWFPQASQQFALHKL